MADLTEKQKKYLECLLADFVAIKAEIARRSTLQRIVFVSYITILTFIGKAVASGSETATLITGLWIMSALLLNFYSREALEIYRLGLIVKKRITPTVANILDVENTKIFHSQTNANFSKINKITKQYNQQFKWAVFFILPLFTTIFYFYSAKLPELWVLCTITSIIACIWILCLLKLKIKMVSEREKIINKTKKQR